MTIKFQLSKLHFDLFLRLRSNGYLRGNRHYIFLCDEWLEARDNKEKVISALQTEFIWHISFTVYVQFYDSYNQCTKRVVLPESLCLPEPQRRVDT